MARRAKLDKSQPLFVVLPRRAAMQRVTTVGPCNAINKQVKNFRGASLWYESLRPRPHAVAKVMKPMPRLKK